MAVPKIFQTFNSLLGGIVRKRNATIVGPSKQLVGEFPEVDFEKLYQYYHHWDQIKTAVDVMHQKFRGSGISITSNNSYFNKFIEKWWDISNAEKKWSQFIYSMLITGSAIMELQYTPDGRIGNVEQIPMQTIYRIFRDQYGNELKLVQIVDGVFKELDPKFFIHHTVNNPDRQAFGKSMFHTLASPRPISGAVDPITGDSINPSRNSMSLLDAQAVLQSAEIEIKKKMAKPRLIVSANGMPREQMEQIQSEMADENTDQYIWIFDKPVSSAELQVTSQGKFGDYAENVDSHIDIGTVFASNVITKPQGFSYSGGQTPLDVLDQRMIDLQTDLAEVLKDRLIRPLAESWGFDDFDMMEVKITFTPIVKRLTMEDIRGLDPQSVSAKERRELYKKLNIELNDNDWEEEKNEMKSAQDGMGGDPFGGMGGNPFGGDPTDGESPMPQLAVKNEDVEENKKQNSVSGDINAPADIKVSEPKMGKKDEFTIDAPKPEKQPLPKNDMRKPYGESFVDKMIKQIANESGLSTKDKMEMIKAFERIPLAPSATQTSTDLYVGMGVDRDGKPEITDPEIRQEYGMDEDEEELPPTSPKKNAKVGDKATLGLEARKDDEDGDGNAHQGGTGNDGINDDSDGTYKDPTDAKGDLERTSEDGNTALKDPHARPVQKPMTDMTGGSDPHPNNTKDQIIGSSDNDEQPTSPSESDPNDKKDIIYGEDPLTSGTSEDPNPDPEIRKEFPRVDDQPLTEEPNTFENPDEDIVGDTSQVRLHLDDQGEDNPDELLPNDSTNVMDNTGLNVKPEYETMDEDDYRKVQDGSNPLEQEGDPLEDGMIVKPEDVQQTEPDGFHRGTNIVPQEISEDEYKQELNMSDSDVNDPTLSGIDEDQVDPDILHTDPETGINYTDLTDEQGNEVPDLRFDQSEDSDEKQPEVELEFEIITKDEYEDEVDAKMSQDDFNNELENPDPSKPNPFETPVEENPFEQLDDSVDNSGDNIDNDGDGLTDESDEPVKDSIGDNIDNDEDGLTDESDEDVDIEKQEIDKQQDEQIKDYEQRIRKLEKMNKLDKKVGKMEQDSNKNTVKDILNREKELMGDGIDEEEVLKELEQEFGSERMNKAVETKTWRKAHGKN